MKKCFSIVLNVLMCMVFFSFRGRFSAEASFSENECAIFPASIMNINCLAYEQENNNGTGANHGGQNAFDMVPTVDVVAPFTGKVVNLVPSWGYVVLQSCDNNGNPQKVYYADGSLDYMTACFMHDNDISDLELGQVIRKGEPFYQQGSAGGNYGAHVHVSVDRGLTDGVRNGYYGNGDVYGFEAFL